jgi:hypothetical protein
MGGQIMTSCYIQFHAKSLFARTARVYVQWNRFDEDCAQLPSKYNRFLEAT